MSDLVRDVSPEALTRARRNVNDVPELSNLVRQAREENLSTDWLTDQLAVRLSAMWGGKDYQEAEGAARVIAHDLLGAAPVIVTDRATGKTLAHLPEDAIWQPEAVPREDGTLATPLARLRPDVEAQLIEQVHVRAHEQKVVSEALERSQPSQLLREDGARMLDILSRDGRTRMVEEIRQKLLDRVEHYFTNFYAGLGDFRLNLGLHQQLIEFRLTHTLRCEATIKLPDPKTVNTRHDWAARTLQVMSRDLVLQVVSAVADSVYLDAEKAAPEDAVAPKALLQLVPSWVSVVTGVRVNHHGILKVSPYENMVLNFVDPSVQLVLDPQSLKVQHVEFNDKLVIRAEIGADIQVDPRGIKAFNVGPSSVEALAFPVR